MFEAYENSTLVPYLLIKITLHVYIKDHKIWYNALCQEVFATTNN